MGLVSQGTLTSYGISLLDSLNQDSTSWEVSPSYTEDFNRFWKAYPATDGFDNFPATRNIRVGKKEAFKEWRNLISEGFTSEQIISGLTREVASRKNSSTFRGGNNLKFIKSPKNYLQSRCFLDFEEEEIDETFEDDGSNYA